MNIVKKLKYNKITFRFDYDEKDLEAIGKDAANCNLMAMFSIITHNQAVLKAEIKKLRKIISPTAR